MKEEKSCGGVIFDEDRDKILLVYEKRRGYWGLPKGHVEGYEDEMQTARREIMEEVGLEVNVMEEYRYETRYIINDEIEKTAVFYMCTPMLRETNLTIQEEIEEAKWFTFDEALETISYDNLKEILAKAIEEYKEIKKIADIINRKPTIDF